ncbi:FG-GAP repeat protein [Streptomyces sp. NBC_00201]|uniref:FG-GAP repeat protein n=1 Tax=Streptomyces sp. NBC_00201 TaxID=2975679 RepID=UPI002258B80A|nr:FG-GAP repeat protein [Streptomyces sp. NBC_00201]MCX5248377.1 FG-GAP repeat protein [Streptomyces sp. NBC_00201]
MGAAQDSAVTVARGSASGVCARATWKRYTEDTPGVPGTHDTADRFGESLSAADITGDGIDDLAVGLPGRELGQDDDAGAVDILRGSRAGLTDEGAQSFTQDTAGVPGAAEAHDAFGPAVELLDINGNGYADLAAAAVGEDGNGAVWELPGRPTGIVTDAALVFGPKAVGAPYAGAAFGSELGWPALQKNLRGIPARLSIPSLLDRRTGERPERSRPRPTEESPCPATCPS